MILDRLLNAKRVKKNLNPEIVFIPEVKQFYNSHKTNLIYSIAHLQFVFVLVSIVVLNN